MASFGEQDLDPLVPRAPSSAMPTAAGTFGQGDLDPGAPPPPKQTEPGFGEKAIRFADDLARSVAQGITMGYGDEIAAKLSEVTGIGGQTDAGDYESLVAAERERQAEIPAGIAIPGEVAGAVAGGVVAAPRLAAGAVRMAPRLAELSKLPKWLKAMYIGATAGGLYGSGQAEEGERLAGAGAGAAAGALTAGGLYPAVAGTRAAGRRIGAAGRETFMPERAARRALTKAVGQDELTIGRMRARLRALGPQASMADVGGANVLGLARGAAGMPGPAKNRAMQMLTTRAEGEAVRIEKALGKGLNPRDYFAASDDFVEALKTRAGPWYDEAYERFRSVMTPEIRRVLDTPAGRKALKTAATKMRNDASLAGQPTPELTAALAEARAIGASKEVTGFGVAEGLKLRTLDYVKRSLDDQIETAARAGKPDNARILRGLKNRLVRSLDKATGGKASPYAKARRIYSSDAEVLGALEEGRGFLKLDREVIRREIDKLSPSAQEAYRSGAVRALMDKVNAAGDKASAARRIFGNTLLRGKVRELFPSQGAYTEFRRAMVAETKFAETQAAIGAGSRTVPMSEEVASVQSSLGNIGAVLGSALPLGGHDLVRAGIGRRLTQSLIGGGSDEYNQALARMLFNRNQSMNQRLLDVLEGSRVPTKAEALQIDLFVRGVLVGAGQQAGGAAGEVINR